MEITRSNSNFISLSWLQRKRLYLLCILSLHLQFVPVDAVAQYSKLLDFNGSTTGNFPNCSLIFDGTFLYGTTVTGGTNGQGTVFKIKPDGTGYATLLNFDIISNGSQPEGSLIFDGAFLYGTTSGGSGGPTIFKIKTDGTGYVRLLDFNGANGSTPNGDLILVGSILYGMTFNGGTNNLGTIFKINTDGTGYFKLLDFNGINGRYPKGSIISDGTFLYGMTNDGGVNDLGKIFKILPDGTGFTTLIDFGITTGANPQGSLLFDGMFLYGMTNRGGTNSQGTIFKIKPDGTGYNILLNLDVSTGTLPRGSLIYDGTFLFGMTYTGGTNALGTIFKIKPDGTAYAKLMDFTGPANGGYPLNSLLLIGSTLYGTTLGGGTNNVGSLFSLLPPPTITSFTPTSGPIGTTVTITGTNFSSIPNDNIIRFNGTAAVVTASTATSISTAVPANATTGLIEVIVGGNTATSTDDFTVTPHVPTGNVVQLNGTTDLIEIPDNVALQPQSLTLEAWVNFSSTNSSVVLLGKAWNQPSVGNSYAIYQGGGRLYSIINDTPMNAPWAPVINTWNHVALTYNNATQTQTLYLNGNALTSAFTAAPVQYSAGKVSIGSDIDFNNPSGFFHGKMDEVRIWNVARTEAEIQATLNEILVGNEPNLVAYYKMDEIGQGAGINVQNSATATGAALNGTTLGTACTPIFTILSPTTITSFTPTSGLPGTTVTITGTNFTGATDVTFNGTPSTSFTVVSATSITTTVPSGVSTGTVNITVGCNTATSTGDFIVTTAGNQPPLISPTTTSASINGIVIIELLNLLSDPDDNLDLSTLTLLSSTSEQGAAASINASSELVLDYGNVFFAGVDRVSIEVCDLLSACSQQELSIEVGGDVVVYNAISPNGDGKNETLVIQYIDILPETQNNKVTIYNRWGDEVFEMADYNNDDRVFIGLNKSNNKLPSGIYFYKIEFEGSMKSKTGYLVLKH